MALIIKLLLLAVADAACGAVAQAKDAHQVLSVV